MPVQSSNADPFVKVADGLRELELVVGPKARPVVAELRARLADAAAMRTNGNVAGAVDVVRQAMDRLAVLGSEVDPEEGGVMRMIASMFSQALSFGDKDSAKQAIDIMRRRAGDSTDKPKNDW